MSDTFHNNLAIILTVRCGSERLPNKALADVCGKPLTYWITERLSRLGQTVIATTDDASDDALVAVAHDCDVPIYRGSRDDVVSRMDNALRKYVPNAEFVLRGLGDMPFLATELQAIMTDKLKLYKKDMFVWALAPYVNTVYGSRESMYSRKSWDMVVKASREREHVDNYFHAHRDKFDILYHEAPANTYFRNYRLEVDYPADLEMVRKIAEDVGMLSPVPDIVRYLDGNHDVAMLNHACVEKTGLSCVDYKTQRAWVKAMTGQPVITWQDTVFSPPSSKATPVFCKGGRCHLGYSDNDMILYRKDGSRIAAAFVSCECGNGLFWGKR